MLKKYSVLLGISMGIGLLVIATLYYPGGSQHDVNSIGFNWQHNYVSNLFNEKAVNGAVNTSQPWAICGMFFLCTGFAICFIGFSKKIPKKSAAVVIKYFGAGAMICAFFIATPLHDIMVTISGTMALVAIFYVTVFVLKSKLNLFKILCIICLLVFYCCNYLYYTSSYLEILPIMQKILFFLIVILVLGLEYFTKAADFEHIK